MLLAPAAQGAAARGRRAAGRGAARAAGRRARARRGRRPGLPEPVPGRRAGTPRRVDARAGRGRGLGPAAPPLWPSGSTSSSCRPTRPGRCTAGTRATPPTATRSRGCSSSPATTSQREYYFNDAGCQVQRFGASIQARARGEEVPEDGYQGAYVAELAARIPDAASGEPLERRAARRRAHARADPRVARAPSASTSTSGTLERVAARGRADAGRPRFRAPRAARQPSYRAEGALWLRTTALRRRQGPRARALDGRAHLLRRPTSPTTRQARARLRPPDRRARAPTTTATSQRVKAAFAGARRRSRSARAADHAVRPPRRARRARVDVQAQRRVRHARRADRRDRRRRGALVSCSRARTTRRSTSTSTWRASSRARTPSTTSSTRTRGSRRCCARRAGRAAAGAGAARRPRAAARRARAGQEAAGVPGRGRRGGRAPRAAPDRHLRARARAGVHGLLPRLPRAAARSPAAARRCASRSAARPGRAIARSLDLLGVSAPDAM